MGFGECTVDISLEDVVWLMFIESDSYLRT